MTGLPEIQFVAPVRASVKIGDRSVALGPIQWRIMQLLAGGAIISAEQFNRELYGRRRAGNAKLIATHICLLNRRLRGSGIRIANQKTRGWFIAGERSG